MAITRQVQEAPRLVGKTATTSDQLEYQAERYLRERLERPRGLWREGLPGFSQKTLPIMLGRRPSLWAVVALLLKTGSAFATAMVAIVIRRESTAVAHGATPSLLQLLGGLTPLDWLFGFVGVGLYALPKIVDGLGRPDRTPGKHPNHALESCIGTIPRIDGGTAELKRCLDQVLVALREEMAVLVDDPTSAVTDVTLLQYCDAAGTQMQVTARTKGIQGLNRPRPANLFLAHYVAKKGRWFAEHNFTSSANPFKAARISVPGDLPVTYESILFMPIMSTMVAPSVRSSAPAAASTLAVAGAEAGQVDCCMGVICVHTEKPYRFWKWGDHKKQQGKGGMGTIAMQQASPYISLITKLLDSTAHRIQVEVNNG